MAYLEMKEKFITARSNLIETINRYYGDSYQEEVGRFIEDTNNNMKKLDRYNLAVANNIGRSNANRVAQEIYGYGTSITNELTDILKSGDKSIIEETRQTIPEILHAISGILSRSLGNVASLLINNTPKGRGRSH